MVTASDGVEIAVHHLGGQGRPLVMAHASGLHGLVWKPLAARLAAQARCISFDARGHGDSGVPPDDDFDWRGLGRDILAVVDTLGHGHGDGRPVGFGHSSGATALLLAEQARAGTFAALYCFEPVIVPADPPLGRDPDNWLGTIARRRREVFSSRQEAYANYASKPPWDRVDPDVLSCYIEDGVHDLADESVRLKCRREHEARLHEMATAHDGFSRLGEVACPVVVACGSATEAYGPLAIAHQVARLPRGRTEVVAGLTHFGPLEDTDALARSVTDFLVQCFPDLTAP